MRSCPRCHGRGVVQSTQDPLPFAPARNSDPETSHAASKNGTDVRRFGAESNMARLLRVLALTPKTSIQAALEVGGETLTVSALEGIRRRVSDLVTAGYLIDSGDRACNPGSSQPAIVWKVTDEGFAALYRLMRTGRSM